MFCELLLKYGDRKKWIVQFSRNMEVIGSALYGKGRGKYGDKKCIGV